GPRRMIGHTLSSRTISGRRPSRLARPKERAARAPRGDAYKHSLPQLPSHRQALPAAQLLLHRVEPADPDRKALACEQRRGLIERQPDDVGIGADALHHEAAGNALCRIAAGLAAPLTGGEIGLDILLRQPLEAHFGFDQTLPESLLGRDQADRGVDPVIAAREQAQALCRLI